MRSDGLYVKRYASLLIMFDKYDQKIKILNVAKRSNLTYNNLKRNIKHQTLCEKSHLKYWSVESLGGKSSQLQVIRPQ